ncbi:MAG TPA: tetratricopeptide repeat protein [Acidobacteria bacterium]|nr:tetratricopeptide repeat protein [Acidobacteriota bacterium]
MSFFWLLLGLVAGLIIGTLGASGTLRWQRGRRRSGPYRQRVDAALAHVAAGDHAAAREALREATQLESGDDAIFLLLGEEMRRSGDFSRAEKIFDVVLARRELDPGIRSTCHLLRGRLMEDEGRDEEALEAYRQAIEAAPDRVPPIVALGRLHSRFRRWEEAIDNAEKLQRLNPERGRLIAARRRVLLAREKVAEGDARGALELARKAAADVPDLAAAKVALGDALYQLGKVAAAREAWVEAAGLAPWLVPASLDRLESLATATGDREAVRHFATAEVDKGLDPDVGWRVLAWLADEALRRDALGEARRWCRELERSAPRSATAARLWARLAAAEDGMRAGPALLEVLHGWQEEPIWIDPWTCRSCGHESGQLEWRCPRCQAWESYR